MMMQRLRAYIYTYQQWWCFFQHDGWYHWVLKLSIPNKTSCLLGQPKPISMRPEENSATQVPLVKADNSIAEHGIHGTYPEVEEEYHWFSSCINIRGRYFPTTHHTCCVGEHYPHWLQSETIGDLICRDGRQCILSLVALQAHYCLMFTNGRPVVISPQIGANTHTTTIWHSKW